MRDENNQKVYVLDGSLCRHLRGAILVMSSCLKGSAEFARAITAPEIGVRAVIGYDNYLYVADVGVVRKWMTPEMFERYRQEFMLPLWQPVLSLVLARSTVEDAVLHAKRVWDVVSHSRTFPVELTSLCCTNKKSLGYWGDGSATFA
jgi:hypothetical protein